jgi:aldehyde:ferredoxin oxidoreductase
MQLGGYAGNILYVNLSSGSVESKPLPDELARDFIGGAGINNHLAADLIPPDTDPLSPANAIIIGTGPFNGTFIPGSSQTMSMYRSPLNGAYVQSNGGGCFSSYLKSCGFDHLVISGSSGKPVYLHIEHHSASLRDAANLWGLDNYDTVDELRRRHGHCSVIPIGPAGERLAPISVTNIDKVGTIGSGGLAAVMGSKNLKAIVACRGSHAIEVADPMRLQQIVDGLLEKIQGYHLRGEMMQGGSMTMTRDWIPPGIVIRNGTELVPYPPEAASMKEQVYRLHRESRKKLACATCPMSDKDRIDIPGTGTFYDTAVFMEMAIMTTSSALGHIAQGTVEERYALALKYYDEINRLGLDRVYSFTGLADYAITLYEKGIISRADAGFELDRSYDTLVRLMRMTAAREGIGDVLAGGINNAVNVLGGQEPVQNVIKGQFVFADPRMTGLLPLHIGMLTHPGRCFGASAALGAPSYSPGWPVKEIRKNAERCGVPPADIDRLIGDETFNLGALVRHGEDFFNLFNMLGQCHRLYISRFFSLQVISELYSAVTGLEKTPAELKEASALTWNQWLDLNSRAGFTRKDNEPPEIWFKPLKGPDREYTLYDYFLRKEINLAEINQVLDQYYAERTSA